MSDLLIATNGNVETVPGWQIEAKCPLPGFEGVTVVFDLMASEADLDAALRALGKQGTYQKIITRIDGWPDAYGEPFGSETPVAFCVWAVRVGWREALTALIVAPNF